MKILPEKKIKDVPENRPNQAAPSALGEGSAPPDPPICAIEEIELHLVLPFYTNCTWFSRFVWDNPFVLDNQSSSVYYPFSDYYNLPTLCEFTLPPTRIKIPIRVGSNFFLVYFSQHRITHIP